ncbi:aromatic-ring-hydroxylating dioxygenase subunit beta [Roseomonas xinghualingensis]|uniref:aromatic-ring-hydroxylating dioxygenase subunit beta n=1 Tax=Roseomonas xinghualingensis TaxID=2986475 RepID=UPI0021F176FB|nr:aromatic-ring-hydroxylating dioxygenase subunit beta [Roseomonas sp. SXEYE001]MCV4210230.1 aromatic-ring-hydroxylating dioxygenase subunit beta [Roseomonas sp. SXEYE001]
MQITDIIAAQARYARCIDTDQLEAWPGFFTEDCLYRITTAENHRLGYAAGIIWADSRGMLEDRVAALREANIYERHSYRHILGLPLLEDEGPEGVRSETPFLVARIMRDGATDLFATGRYLDLWRADEAGAPKLAERIVVCDSSRTDTLLALPL